MERRRLPEKSRLFEWVRGSKINRTEVLQSTGNASEARKPGGRTLQATYDMTMNTHGSIGPSCAVADFKDGFLTVWTPTQACHLLRPQLATMLQLPPERIRCIFIEGAGCYGRNGADDCSSEAALIATMIGRPVRLQWMRADETAGIRSARRSCSTTAPTQTAKARSPGGKPTYF